MFPGYADFAFRIHFFGDEIEEIESFDPARNSPGSAGADLNSRGTGDRLLVRQMVSAQKCLNHISNLKLAHLQ